MVYTYIHITMCIHTHIHIHHLQVDNGRMCGFVGTSSVEMLEVFELSREGEAAAFSKHSAKKERQLLWYVHI